MKRILIGIAIFALGLAIGGGVMGYLVKRVYEKQMMQIYSMGITVDVILAQQLRAGLAQLILESADRRIVQGILESYQNEQLRDLGTTAVALSAAKEYYTCSKIEFPPEIAQILHDLPPVSGLECQPE